MTITIMTVADSLVLVVMISPDWAADDVGTDEMVTVVTITVMTVADSLVMISPDWVPRLFLRTVAAPVSGVSAAVITNPLDVIRARIQVCALHFLMLIVLGNSVKLVC